MRQLIFALGGLALLASIAAAQTPIEPRGIGSAAAPMKPATTLPPPPSGAPAKLPSELLHAPIAELKPNIRTTKFDAHAVEVRRNGAHWQLWSGKTLLKDFGEYRDRAFEARRLVAELNLTERATIGTPEPVMEYWLSDGQSPPLPAFNRSVINFDPQLLAVKSENGAYYVGDLHRLLFNFGPYQQDAQQALAVIRKFGFNEIGFVGSPNPSMTYMLNNPNQRQQPPLPPTRRPQLLPQMALRHPLDLPGAGRVGEYRNFDPMRLDIVKSGDGWHLTAGTMDLGLLGQSEYQARNAMQIAQQFPLTEQVRIGGGDFSFYLSHHVAPRGVPLGIRQTMFKSDNLSVKQVNNQWQVTDGKVAVATLTSAADANFAIAAIRHFGFNCICEAGQGLKFFVQDR